jgi:hypothetical protein
MYIHWVIFKTKTKMVKVKFLQDHHYGIAGTVTELDEQTAETFQKMGIVEVLPNSKKDQKENATAKGGATENAAV